MENFEVCIIGSGAAGLNSALQLVKRGIDPKKIAIITENLGGGTSFDAGSDKQTYYKMSLVNKVGDSPNDMAHSLYDGGSMHGDIALIESTCSIQAFMNLVNIGVPFPHDKYGAFVGYKTDNDDKQRGTSAGPLTSRIMSEKLIEEVKKYPIKMYNKQQVIKIIYKEKQPFGIVTIDLNYLDLINNPNTSSHNTFKKIFKSFKCKFIIIATGGSSGIYEYSVYPESQWGSLGLSINLGLTLQNLTESQFGLASTDFRWNVSGTYQQVIPRYISCAKGSDPLNKETEWNEFLIEYFPSPKELVNAIFLKDINGLSMQNV